MRTEKMNYYFPIGLFLAMFLDGGLTQVFAKQMFTNTMAMESRLVLLFIVMAVCYGNVEHLVMWSAIVGLFYDMFYTGILGVPNSSLSIRDSGSEVQSTTMKLWSRRLLMLWI